MLEIPYKPRNWANLLHNSTKRWNVLIIHRQGGKTTAALNHLQKDALLNPNTKYAYIAPTYKQAKNVAWEKIKEYSRVIPGINYNEVDLKVKYPNNSTITLYGADNPDSLRGITLNGVIFDEYSQQPSNIFSEIIKHTLSTTGGYGIWIGTPKGKNQLFEVYQQGLKDPQNWLVVFKTIDDTLAEETGETIVHLKAHLEDSLRLVEQGLITEDELRQELYCSFDASIKGAYYSTEIERLRSQGRYKSISYNPESLVYTVWDLGVSDATSIGFYQKIGNQLWMIDYYENQGVGLTHYINTLKSKNYTYGAHYAPHDINVREFTSGKSRKDIASELGIHFRLVPDVPVADGIDAGRRIFPRLIVNANTCEDFLDKLAQYHKEWDDKRATFKDRPKHDFTSHAADVHRYMALSEGEWAPDTEVPNMEFNLYAHNYT